MAELDELDLNPPVPPRQIVRGDTDDELADRGCRGRPTGTPPSGVVPLTRDESPVPGDSSPGSPRRELAPAWRPSTINIIISVPVPLSDAAYVNAVMTATEAKTQALLEAGFHAAGTASDAICVPAPAAGRPQDFAGPRSLWGVRIAGAVHAAVHAGALRYRAKSSPA